MTNKRDKFGSKRAKISLLMDKTRFFLKFLQVFYKKTRNVGKICKIRLKRPNRIFPDKIQKCHFRCIWTHKLYAKFQQIPMNVVLDLTEVPTDVNFQTILGNHKLRFPTTSTLFFVKDNIQGKVLPSYINYPKFWAFLISDASRVKN